MSLTSPRSVAIRVLLHIDIAASVPAPASDAWQTVLYAPGVINTPRTVEPDVHQLWGASPDSPPSSLVNMEGPARAVPWVARAAASSRLIPSPSAQAAANASPPSAVRTASTFSKADVMALSKLWKARWRAVAARIGDATLARSAHALLIHLVCAGTADPSVRRLIPCSDVARVPAPVSPRVDWLRAVCAAALP